MLLDELIDRHTEGAILTVSPYVLDSGETLRWILQVDGQEVPDADVRIEEDPEHPDWMVMFLVRGNEELEIARWSTTTYKYGPGLRHAYPRTAASRRSARLTTFPPARRRAAVQGL